MLVNFFRSRFDLSCYFFPDQPPKRDLKVSDPKVRDLTLFELQLAPSSVLLLRFEDESLNSSSLELAWYDYAD